VALGFNEDDFTDAGDKKGSIWQTIESKAWSTSKTKTDDGWRSAGSTRPA
jgi:hypothetical protein